MNKFHGVKIIKITPVNPRDPRGLTYEWCKGQQGLQVTICERKRGCSFGNHYHKGNDPSKNPEKNFLAKGKVILRACNRSIKHSIKLLKRGMK